MAPSMTATSFAPYQPSPLAASTSHFGDHRASSPSTPRRTARLWDEYERRAIENAKRRETTCGTSAAHSQRLSNGTVLDIIRSYDPTPSTASSPKPEFEFSTAQRRASPKPATVAVCKSCNEAIKSSCGVCEKCMKTIVLPSSGESTPLLSPSCRNFGTTDLPKLHKESTSGSSTPVPSSPKRRPQRKPSADFPVRLASLQPPANIASNRTSSDTPRCRARKSSIDPSEPFLRLHISRKPVPRTHPSSPTTPTSVSRSAHPSSATPSPRSQHHHTTYTRHPSVTPSELSTLYPYISHSTTATAVGATTPPSRTSRSSYAQPNTMSAWDDWDSDEDGSDKVGLVGYWRGRKWRGSRGSLSSAGAGAGGVRRDSGATEVEDGGDVEEGTKGKKKDKTKRRGFVRAISCGC